MNRPRSPCLEEADTVLTQTFWSRYSISTAHIHRRWGWGAGRDRGKCMWGKAWVPMPALPSPSGATPGKKEFYFSKPQFPSL